METEFKILVEKDGMKFSRIEKNHYMLSFSMQNQHIFLKNIINFDLIKLIYDLNNDIYEKVHLEKINEQEAIITLVMKHFFVDMGLPQKYSYLHIQKLVEENMITFHSQTIYGSKPQDVPEEAEIVPLKSVKIICETIDQHKMNATCSVYFNENHRVPVFAEKFVGMILYKIFNRLKQFIENYRI